MRLCEIGPDHDSMLREFGQRLLTTCQEQDPAWALTSDPSSLLITLTHPVATIDIDLIRTERMGERHVTVDIRSRPMSPEVRSGEYLILMSVSASDAFGTSGIADATTGRAAADALFFVDHWAKSLRSSFITGTVLEEAKKRAAEFKRQTEALFTMLQERFDWPVEVYDRTTAYGATGVDHAFHFRLLPPKGTDADERELVFRRVTNLVEGRFSHFQVLDRSSQIAVIRIMPSSEHPHFTQQVYVGVDASADDLATAGMMILSYDFVKSFIETHAS